MNKHFRRALFLVLLMATMSACYAQVVVRISVAPPVLPVYVQPECPVPGYLWTPGYWAYGDAGYYWVPGVWVQPPSVGLLWTPGYWGFEGPVYVWHAGYWGPHIGFYGGVNYGFGYTGVGFLGGVWAGSVFRYNTAVMHVGGGFHDVYVDRAAIVEGGVRTSFNGPGGLRARPSEAERIAERDHHIERTEMQRSHEHGASLDRSARFSENHGRPANAAMARAHAENRAAAAHGPAGHAGPAAGHAGPAASHAGPAASHAGPAASHAGPAASHAGPAAGHASPAAGRAGPAAGHASPAAGRAGPAAGHAGPAAGHAGPAAGRAGPAASHAAPAAAHAAPARTNAAPHAASAPAGHSGGGAPRGGVQHK